MPKLGVGFVFVRPKWRLGIRGNGLNETCEVVGVYGALSGLVGCSSDMSKKFT